MENSAVVNQTGPLCPVGSALRVPPLGYRMVKRAFDLTAALILSVLLAVPAAILMLLIRLDSPGPAIFRQERLGKNGKPFMILKLRSMRLDAEKNGPDGRSGTTAAARVWAAFSADPGWTNCLSSGIFCMEK